jgi:hypothetical protein
MDASSQGDLPMLATRFSKRIDSDCSLSSSVLPLKSGVLIPERAVKSASLNSRFCCSHNPTIPARAPRKGPTGPQSFCEVSQTPCRLQLRGSAP